jgi:MFS family permease
VDVAPSNVNSELKSVDDSASSSLSVLPVLTPSRVIAPIAFSLSKVEIRSSLHASTVDGVFAAIFTNIIGGVLLTNFLLELGASPTQIGIAAAIPMLANLLQPLGAYLSEKTSSRRWYSLWIYAPSRLLWLVLVLGIGLASWGYLDPPRLVGWALAIAMLSYGVGALGSAPWLSWMAAIVPAKLRGRYFGFRNSGANLTALITIPLGGLVVSHWVGGSLEGYGIALGIAVVAGLLSLASQGSMTDVNPLAQQAGHVQTAEPENSAWPALPAAPPPSVSNPLRDRNLLTFLLYFGLWMFAVNLGTPFFNLYLLDNLSLDVSQVTFYNSLTAAANLLMLMLWGKLADRVGNRPILLGAGILVALTPLLWLWMGTNSLSIWLWLPLLHFLIGGSWAATDLCGNNIQLAIAPLRNQSTYFGIVAAIAGISGASGTLLGGFLAEFWHAGGLLGLFVLSSLLRLAALIPLAFVQESRSLSIRNLLNLLYSAFKPVETQDAQP